MINLFNQLILLKLMGLNENTQTLFLKRHSIYQYLDKNKENIESISKTSKTNKTI